MKRTAAFVAVALAALSLAGQALAMGGSMGGRMSLGTMSSQSSHLMAGNGMQSGAGENSSSMHSAMTASGSSSSMTATMQGPIADTASSTAMQGTMADTATRSQMQGMTQKSTGSN